MLCGGIWIAHTIKISIDLLKLKVWKIFTYKNYVFNFLIQFQYETNNLHNVVLALHIQYNDAVDGFKVT